MGGVPARARTAVALALAAAACSPGPTEDEERGRTQIAAIPVEKRAEWAADIARYLPAARLWDRNRAGGPFEPMGTYVFGKFQYTLELYRRGEEIALVCWGIDYSHPVDGNAWLAIGSGRRTGDTARVIWSCLGLTASTSMAGGARLDFEDEDRVVVAEYYHDTDPTHLQWGTGVRVDASGAREVELDLVAHQDLRLSHLPRDERIRIRGLAAAGERPVRGAAIHVRGSKRIEALTGPGGTFEFEIALPRENILLACSAPGYHNAGAWVRPDAPIARFELVPLPARDDPDYRFASPVPEEGDLFRCGNCHDVHYDQWRRSTHALASANPFYRAGAAREARASCRPCHEPALHFEGAPEDASAGPRTAGVGCDPCHKIVHVEPADPVPTRNRLLRPDPQDDSRPGPVKLVFGPLADATFHYMGATHHVLYERSRYCAGCHELASERGVPVDTTWSDWFEWSRRAEKPRTCQECHMPPTPDAKQIARYQLPRDPSQFHDHSFPLSPEGPEADALPVEVDAGTDGERLRAVLRLANTAGHPVPAGKAGRTVHLVLLAETEDGGELALVEGEVLGPDSGIPDEEGLSSAEKIDLGALAGLPGRAFLRRLAPAGAPFSRAESVAADERIPPGEEVRIEATWSVGGGSGPWRIRALLLSRPVPWEEWKRTPEAADTALDRILAEKTLKIERNPR